MGLDRHGPWYGWSDCVILDIADAILRLDGLEIKLILTSHGGILQERQIRPAWRDSLNHLVQRENKISGLLEKGLSRQQIIDQGIFYPHKGRIKEPLKSILTMWDKSMVQQHIDLIKDGGLKYFFPELKNFE